MLSPLTATRPMTIAHRVALGGQNAKAARRRLCGTRESRLELRACSLDGVADVELLEVLDEQLGQTLGGFVVGSLVSPGVAWVEQDGFDAGDGLGYVQIDDRQVLGLGTDQRAALDGCNHRTGGRD